MPKGRGAQKRRQSGRQHRPKDKEETTGRGYVKLMGMLGRHNDLAMARRKGDPIAEAVKVHYTKSTKRGKARRKARSKWNAQ